MSLKHFGTDGIRGPYGGPSVNDNTAFHAGRAAALLARRHRWSDTPRIVVGRDTRLSGAALASAFSQGVIAEGGSVADIGIAPTPGIAKAASASEAVMACSITASHNPHEDNGLKFFTGQGLKLSEALEQELDSLLDSLLGGPVSLSPDFKNAADSGPSPYEAAVGAAFPADFLKGKRLALDCANGALSSIAPRVFAQFGAEVDLIGVSPDGRNINLDVGSEHPELLQALCSKGGYDCGFAFDGDGDRVIVFDERGQKLPGEATLALLATRLKASNALPQNTLVTTVQSNLGLDAALASSGIATRRVDVGDKHISRLMQAERFGLGGEESGHLIIGAFSITGDGLVAALKIASELIASGQPLSALASVYRAFPQATNSIRVAAKRPLVDCAALCSEIAAIESEFGPAGRLLVRFSGTEPKLRLLAEAKTIELANAAISRLVKAAGTDLEIVG